MFSPADARKPGPPSVEHHPRVHADVSPAAPRPVGWRALPGLPGTLTNERRLVICLAVTLIAIQAGLMLFLRSEHEGLTLAAIRDVLQSGHQIVRNQVVEEQENLADATKLMASEFGLRQAVATRDQPTIDSMLENHQARSSRVHFSVQPLPSDATGAAPGEPGATVNLLDLTVVRDAGPFRLVAQRSADILAPRPIAQLRGRISIDDDFAKRLAKLTGFELIVSGSGAGHPHRVWASSLSPDATKTAFDRLRGHLPGSDAPARASRQHAARVDADASGLADPIHVSSAGTYSFVRVQAIGSRDDGDVWLWIGKLDAKAVPALLDAEAVVQSWILVSLILSVFAVSAVAYKLVRPISASANTDVLTGLPNRRAFVPAAHAALSSCWSQGQPVALLSMDLDKFKPINDTLGHAAGDDVLRVIGARLRSFFRSVDIVARLGGDEFCALLKDVDLDHLQSLTDNVRATLQVPIGRDGKHLVVGCSIGVMVARRGDDLRLEELMDRADAALYAAKRQGGGTVFWTPAIGSMKKHATER